MCGNLGKKASNALNLALICHHDESLCPYLGDETLRGLNKERYFTYHGVKMFGPTSPTHRPEAFPYTTGHYTRVARQVLHQMPSLSQSTTMEMASSNPSQDVLGREAHGVPTLALVARGHQN
jgi:hypothetical protein